MRPRMWDDLARRPVCPSPLRGARGQRSTACSKKTSMPVMPNDACCAKPSMRDNPPKETGSGDLGEVNQAQIMLL